MARWGSAAGLGYGQAFLLVFGFLIASAVIFLLGVWVGQREMSESLPLERERVARATMPPRSSPAPESVGREFYEKVKEQAYRQLQTPAETQAPPSATPLPATPTRAVPTATRTVPAIRPTPQASPRAVSEARPWSVQVGATMDPREALEMTLRLRAQGFEAYTVQAPLRGQTWYRVRVGRFATREEAREVEMRLRRMREYQGAYVTSQ